MQHLFKDGAVCVPPLVTPLNENLEIDVAGLEKLVDYLVEGGVYALFVLGETGEFRYFTRLFNYYSKEEGLKQQRIAIETAVKKADGRVPVFANVTQADWNTTKEQIKYVNGMEHKPNALVLEPLIYDSNDEKLVIHIEEAAKLTVNYLPFLIYNNPKNLPRHAHKKGNIEPQLLRQIANNIHKVIGMKDSSGNFEKFESYHEAVEGGKYFLLFQGDEGLVYKSLNDKSLKNLAGYVPSMANIFPEALVNIANIAKSGEALLMQHHIEIIRQIYLGAGNIPAVLKFLLNSYLGICEAHSFGKKPQHIREIAEQVRKGAINHFKGHIDQRFY